MDLKTTLDRLRAAGTAQNRKVYARHGIREPMFGVSFRELGALQRAIREDDDLAEALWATGNHDARVLATRIASAPRTTVARLERWIVGVDNYVLADALAALAARSPAAIECMRKWLHSCDEWRGSVAFGLVQQLAAEQAHAGDDWAAVLHYIEHNIHGMPNRTRHAMNGAVIAIGAGSERLCRAAIAAAERIGPVHVDHGETGCQTPDAASYIRKVLVYRTERSAGRSARAAVTKAKAKATATAKAKATPAKTKTKPKPAKAKAKAKAKPAKARPRKAGRRG